MTINIEIDDRQISRRLSEVARMIADMRPVLDDVGDAVANSVRMNFHESRSPYGESWAPLRLRDGRPLRDTGRLMNSITHRVVGNSVEIGTNVPYAATHQFGAVVRARRAPFLVFKDTHGGWVRKRQVTIPARQFLPDAQRGLPDDVERTVLDVIGKYLVGGSA